MPIADNREALVRLLARAPGLTQHQIADQMAVSARTARRHLRALRAAGDVRASRTGHSVGFVLADHAYPVDAAPERFSEAEAEALTVAALAARATLAPTPFLRPLESAAAKLCATWVPEVVSFEPEREDQLWSFGGSASQHGFDPAIFRTLLDAVRARTPVLVDYFTASTRTASSGRRLHPLGLLVRDGSWMLAAYCCRSNMVKDFAIPGIHGAAPVDGEVFDPPANFDLAAHAHDRFRALAGDDVYVVRLEVSPAAVPYFERKRYHRTQVVEETRPDGSAVVSFEAEGLEEVATFVRSWGAKVRVVEPGELAERIREEAREVVALYADR